MQITLTQNEFKDAIYCYLTDRGFQVDKYDITVKLIASRNGTGSKAEVTLEPKQEQTATVKETISETPVQMRASKETIDSIFNTISSNEYE